MKNQYVADISDFEKYALLQALRDSSDVPLSVCWMLTPDDESGDGRKLAYLEKPDTFRHRAPHIFDRLRKLVEDGRRDIAAVEEYGILDGASFYDPVLRNGKFARQMYFEDYFATLQVAHWVFFDPDNGLASDRIAPGAKDSSKFLFSDEISTAYEQGHSLVIYQHWGRVNREKAIQERFEQLRALTGATEMGVLWGRSRVAFYVVPQPAVVPTAAKAVADLQDKWQDPERLELTWNARD